MKKNVIGHMTAPRESVGGRLRRWDVFPRLICVLLALVIWLLIVNVQKEAPKAAEEALATASSVYETV